MPSGVDNFVNALQRNSKLRHQGVDFTKMKKFMKKPVPKESTVRPDPPPKPISRPPCSYSNTTPYGIAAELLNKKEVE